MKLWFIAAFVGVLLLTGNSGNAQSLPAQLAFMKDAPLTILIPKTLPKGMSLREAKLHLSDGSFDLDQKICQSHAENACCSLRTARDGLGDTSPVGTTLKVFEAKNPLLGKVKIQLDTWAEGEAPDEKSKSKKWLVTQWYPIKEAGNKSKPSSKDREYTISCDYQPEIGLDEKVAIRNSEVLSRTPLNLMAI